MDKAIDFSNISFIYRKHVIELIEFVAKSLFETINIESTDDMEKYSIINIYYFIDLNNNKLFSKLLLHYFPIYFFINGRYYTL